jgi:hypothetical protein
MDRNDRVPLKKHLSFSSFDDFIIEHVYEPESAIESENQRQLRLANSRCKSAEPADAEFRNANYKRKVSIRAHMPTIYNTMEHYHHPHTGPHLFATHAEKVLAEKSELSELNCRLGRLIAEVKTKKLLNDSLQEEIKAFKNRIISTYNPGDNDEAMYRNRLREELQAEKKRLNEMSEARNFLNIKLFRSGLDLNFKRSVQEEEAANKKQDEEKIRLLEAKYKEGLNEAIFLNDKFEQEKASIDKQVNQIECLQEQVNALNDNLDIEIEKRVNLEQQIQLLHEAKEFEKEMYANLRAEFMRVLDTSICSSSVDFIETEINEMKEKIRRDFESYNECLYENMKEEYRQMLSEKIEEERCIRATHEEEMKNYEFWHAESVKNQLLMDELEDKWNCLNSKYAKLNARLNEHKCECEAVCAQKDCEKADLENYISHIKCELSRMLSTSRSLDSEVSLYARLLGNKQAKIQHEVVTTTTAVTNCPNNNNTTTFCRVNCGNSQDLVNNTSTRIQKSVVNCSNPSRYVDDQVRIETAPPKCNKIPLKPQVAQQPKALVINTVSTSTCTNRPPVMHTPTTVIQSPRAANNKQIYHIVENTMSASMQPVCVPSESKVIVVKSKKQPKNNVQLFEDIQQRCHQETNVLNSASGHQERHYTVVKNTHHDRNCLDNTAVRITKKHSNSLEDLSRCKSPCLVRVLSKDDCAAAAAAASSKYQTRVYQRQHERQSVNSAKKSNEKYAIKHKANRYVSGAIGILETSLNGEFILLENLSSNKNVNLKGWYIHRYKRFLEI